MSEKHARKNAYFGRLWREKSKKVKLCQKPSFLYFTNWLEDIEAHNELLVYWFMRLDDLK